MMFQNHEFRAGLFPDDRNHWAVIAIFTIFYGTWVSLFVGSRSDHYMFLGLILSMFLLHRWSRTFVYCFVFFILFWLVYDSMRVYPNYWVNDIHIAQPYDVEKAIFGIPYDGKILTANEYLKINANPFLDLISGVFYLTWVPVPLALSMYLFFHDRQMLLRFSGVYFLTNLIGFLVYYSYPAAPPWYFAKYGDQTLFNISGDAAQLVRFDNLVNYPVFQNIYTKNSNIFAAIPSLHAAYPVVTWYFARKMRYKIASFLIFIDIIGIWFAAVYSYHHYIIDILLGLFCAIFTIMISETKVIQKAFSTMIDSYLTFVEGNNKNV